MPAGGERQVLLAGLTPGVWSLASQDGKTRFNARVAAGRNTAFFVAPAGDYTARPSATPGAPEFRAAPGFMPPLSASLAHRIVLDGELLAAPPTRTADACELLPAAAILTRLGVTAVAADGGLRVTAGGRTAIFQDASRTVTLNDQRFSMPAPAVHDAGAWFLPDAVLAALIDRDLTRDAAGAGVELTPTRIPRAADILWIEADKDSDLQALRAMLADIPGRTEYWAIEGQDRGFRLTLTRPRRLAGVGIAWHQAPCGRPGFAWDTSVDGIDVKWVSARQSRYVGGAETTRLPTRSGTFASAVSVIRVNAWNSIVHFRLLTAD